MPSQFSHISISKSKVWNWTLGFNSSILECKCRPLLFGLGGRFCAKKIRKTTQLLVFSNWTALNFFPRGTPLPLLLLSLRQILQTWSSQTQRRSTATSISIGIQCVYVWTKAETLLKGSHPCQRGNVGLPVGLVDPLLLLLPPTGSSCNNSSKELGSLTAEAKKAPGILQGLGLWDFCRAAILKPCFPSPWGWIRCVDISQVLFRIINYLSFPMITKA